MLWQHSLLLAAECRRWQRQCMFVHVHIHVCCRTHMAFCRTTTMYVSMQACLCDISSLSKLVGDKCGCMARFYVDFPFQVLFYGLDLLRIR
jgi:hypothetical protein